MWRPVRLAPRRFSARYSRDASLGSVITTSSAASIGDGVCIPPAHNRYWRRAVSVRAFKTAEELQDMIVEQARSLHGPWPSGMTMFVFDDAYGWSASISRPTSEADDFYRTRTLDLIRTFKVRYDLDPPRL